MELIRKYISYVRDIRRYSSRTSQIYEDVLRRYVLYASDGLEEVKDDVLITYLNQSQIRSYIVQLMDECTAATVNLHLSAISGFCRFLVTDGVIKANPAKLVAKPKMEKRLPSFFRKDVMDEYFSRTQDRMSPLALNAFQTVSDKRKLHVLYNALLARLIVSMLYNLAVRRSELISMNVIDVDFSRKVVKIVGKGNKMREIPLLGALCEEILLYLKVVEALEERQRSLKEPLLVTFTGKRIYPVYVDRVVKKELSSDSRATGRKSPHVLRHSLATGLLDEGTDLNSIKEFLGHSSLAATQVYTHNSIAKLKDIYKSAHPRAKKRR